jgi:hypothetical protein
MPLLLLWAVFAPMGAVCAMPCGCLPMDEDGSSLAAVPCCAEGPQHCCFESHESGEAQADPMIEASGSPRLPQLSVAERVSPLPPLESDPVQVVCAPRAERPPGGHRTGLSFRQIWLI